MFIQDYEKSSIDVWNPDFKGETTDIDEFTKAKAYFKWKDKSMTFKGYARRVEVPSSLKGGSHMVHEIDVSSVSFCLGHETVEYNLLFDEKKSWQRKANEQGPTPLFEDFIKS